MHFFIKKINFKSFTLVELLAVIAIVLGLASLISPSLKKLVSRSNTIKCSLNLKVAGIANSLYADDWGDYHVPNSMKITGFANPRAATRWGHLKEFRSYAEWDTLPVPYWMLPHDKACPEAIVRAFDRLSSSSAFRTSPPALKVFYTYGHLALYGQKKYRGMHRNWIQSPSQLGNVGEGWAAPAVTKNKAIDSVWRHDLQSNFLFFDGHIESLYKEEFNDSNAKPWVDSNGDNLTEINEANAPF